MKAYRINRKTFQILSNSILYDPIAIFIPSKLPDPFAGHWTLKNGKDPADTTIYLNSCLFSVIGSQTGEDPSELRKTSILKLKRIPQELAYRMNEIIRLEGNDGIMLMIGGARYNGRSPIDAGRILDKSQNVVAHGYREVGHPRGHASDPNAVGSISSVENYAKSSRSRKTGFLSRCDQNMVAHLALISEEAKGDMNYLNTGDTNNVVSRITNNVLKQLADRYLYNLPQAQWYNADGTPTKNPRDILRVTLILRHHAGQEKNAEADVFVQTFYPEI